MRDCKVVMIFSGFPRRSETFALNQLLALDARSLIADIFATKPGDGSSLHPDCQNILKRVEHLPVGSPAKQAEFVVERLKGQVITGVSSLCDCLQS